MVSLHAREYTELLFWVLVPEVAVRLPKVADLLLHSHALPALEYLMVWVIWLLDCGRSGTWSVKSGMLETFVCPHLHPLPLL